MKILYIDDEQKELDAFMKAYANTGISVEVCQDIYKLEELLAQRKSSQLPDLIVTDLYRTKGDLDSLEAHTLNKKVDNVVAKISECRRNLEVLVNSEKEPVAIAAIEQLQKTRKSKDIPVVVCTREGLNLVDDSLLKKSYELGADWTVKGRPPEVMRAIMVRNALKKRMRIKRDVWMMFGGSLLGAIFSLLLSCGSSNYLP